MGFLANLFGGKKQDIKTPNIEREVSKEQASEVTTKICTNCGAINSNGERSCKDCATPLY